MKSQLLEAGIFFLVDEGLLDDGTLEGAWLGAALEDSFTINFWLSEPSLEEVSIGVAVLEPACSRPALVGLDWLAVAVRKASLLEEGVEVPSRDWACPAIAASFFGGIPLVGSPEQASIVVGLRYFALVSFSGFRRGGKANEDVIMMNLFVDVIRKMEVWKRLSGEEDVRENGRVEGR